MPADTKRKEARKRKFGAQTTGSLPGGGVNIEVEHNSAEEPPRKKAKQAESSQEASEITTAAAKNEAEAPQKAQRFIVFIGMLASLLDVFLGIIANPNSLFQEIYLTRQRTPQSRNTSPKSTPNPSATAQIRTQGNQKASLS